MPEPVYKRGDFVVIYEGMGEIGHGTITGMGARCAYRTFDYGGYQQSYPSSASWSDVRAKTTSEDAMEYYWLRQGYLPLKLWVSSIPKA